MGVYRGFCGLLFWSKVTFAILLAFAGLGYFSLLIAQKRLTALENQKNYKQAPSVDIPTSDSGNTTCYYDPSVTRLEPPAGSFWWGFHLDWSQDTPRTLNQRFNFKKPMVFNAFLSINQTDFQVDMINWMAQECSFQNAILELTLIPQNGGPGFHIEDIPDETLKAVADEMRHVNSLYGVPVLLRYGHEMNGNWLTAYSQRPIQFLASYQKLADYVHAATNMTAMVWSPNAGIDYPFHDVNPGSVDQANFNAMDTNHDGAVDGKDDPYLPYWPGPEYVDWVGFSVYQYSTDPNTRQSIVTPATATSLHDFMSGPPGTEARNGIYQRFATTFNKPFMFSETGAAYHTNVTHTADPVAEELQIKQTWWQYVLRTAQSPDYPLFKLATWFEEHKVEQTFDVPQVYVDKDYRITSKGNILQALQTDLGSNSNLGWVGDFKITCGGKVEHA